MVLSSVSIVGMCICHIANTEISFKFMKYIKVQQMYFNLLLYLYFRGPGVA